jgi:hypothetical protein
MQPISLLVARYGALASKSSVARTAVAEAISKACAARFTLDDVEIGEEGEVRIKVSGARRAALFLNKEAAAAAAAAALGKTIRLK